MNQVNSLEQMSKKDLAEQHRVLVSELMLLWGTVYPMSEWVDPISAVRALKDLASAARIKPQGGMIRDYPQSVDPGPPGLRMRGVRQSL